MNRATSGRLAGPTLSIIMTGALLVGARPASVAAQDIGPNITASAVQTGKILDVNGSVAGGYTDTGAVEGSIDRFRPDLWGDLRLTFLAPGRRANFMAGIGSSLWAYRPSGDWSASSSHAAQSSLSVLLTRRLTASVGAAMSYSPTYQVGVFGGLMPGSFGQFATPGIGNGLSTVASPIAQSIAFDASGAGTGQISAPSLANGVGPTDLWIFAGNAGLAYRLSARSSLAVTESLARVDLPGQDFDTNNQTTAVSYQQNVTRGLGFYVLYAYAQTTHPGSSVYSGVHRGHFANFGVNYNGARSITLSPRTTLGFHFGLGSINRVQAAAGNPDVATSAFYQLIGGVDLNRKLSRTWHANIGYDRNVGFVDGFANPFQTDSVSAGLGGQLGRRLRATFTGRYMRGGALDVSGDGSRYDSYGGVAQLQMVVRPQLWTYVDYFYYRNAFGSALVPVTTSPQQSRQGVRGGLTFALSLLGGRRSAFASR